MDQAAGLLEAALAGTAEGVRSPEASTRELRAELAQTWLQLAQVLDWRVTSYEEAEDEEAEDEDEHGGDSRRAGAQGEVDTGALRLEEVDLTGRAADLYAELGPDHLGDRLQCVQYAAWTEQEIGRAGAGVARLSALVDELRSAPEGVPNDLLERAQSSLDGLKRSS